MDLDMAKMISSLGLAGALVVMLGYVMRRVGERMIQAIDRLASKVDDHTRVDLEHHAKVQADLARLEGRLDGIVEERERTPVEIPLPEEYRQRRPQEVPSLYYSKTKRDKDK